MSLFAPLPDAVTALGDDARERRAIIGDENCALDDARFFLRGLLVVPVAGTDTPFAWGVWAEIARPAYKRALGLWRDARRAGEPPIPAALATELPGMPGSRGLPGKLHLGERGRPPWLELAPGAHPLAQAVREGAPQALARLWRQLAAGGA